MRIRNLIKAAAGTVLFAGMIFASAPVVSAVVVSPSIGTAKAVSARVKASLHPKYVSSPDWHLVHPGFFWTSRGMGGLLAISYFVIALCLFWMANYLRRLPRLRRYNWIFASFAVFILACGATRAMETVIIWWPVYRLLVAIKVLSAAISVAMAVIFTTNVTAITARLGRFFDRLTRKQHQSDALRRSKEFMDRVGRLVDIGGWELDLTNGELTWSAELLRIIGAPLDYKPNVDEALALYPVEARAAITAAIEVASAGGPSWDLELPTSRFDGRPFWVRVVGGVEFRDGKPVRLTGATQDITSRINERMALQKANERVILAADSGGIGIWDWNILEKEFVCDAWMYRLHGLDFQECSEPMEFWTKHLHRDDLAAVVQALTDAVEGIRPYDIDFRVIWKDGTVHRLRATGQVTRDDTGRAIRMVGTNRDISESRRLESDLAEQHELLRVTLQSIGEGVITKDANRNISWMNAVAERLTGWSNAEAIGRPVTEVFKAIDESTRLAEDTHLALFPVGDQAVSSTKPTLLVSRKGSECVIESTASPLRNARGELLGSVLVFRDVTEQRHLALETQHVTTLQLELKLKDQFLSHVSHELRSPLTSIYSFSSIIADNLAGVTSPEQQEYLQIILQNVGQLQAMIEDLLIITRSREGKLSIDLQSVSVSEAITDAVNTLQSAADEKHITLSSVDCFDLPPTCADTTRLRQILIILIDNAVKFTPPGGQIIVQASQTDGDCVLLQVSDTGCGIAAEDRTRVFETLYQVTGPNEPDTSQAGRIGLGLGLHIAWDLVTRQGGQIWITGAPGEGSIFNFSLPIFREATSASNTEAHPLRRKTDRSEQKLPFLLPAA